MISSLRLALPAAFGFIYSFALLPNTHALQLQSPANDSSIVSPTHERQAQEKQAQEQQAQEKQTEQQASPSSGVSEEPDEPATPVPEKVKTDSTAALNLAWQMLTSAASSPKAQTRIDGLNAIGSLKNSTQARTLLSKAMQDPDRDVRVAATTAMATTQDRSFIPQLRQALDDRAAEVSFASAVALWRMHDHSGESILLNVLAGERKASSGAISSELHQANKDLHNPSTLALIGAEQGAYAMLGPFGIGLDAYRLLHKGSAANSARVLTVNLLTDMPTQQIKEEFIAALHDKDYFVRGASARALGNFHGKDVSTALLESFGDQKPAVRFAAAASYIRAATPAPHNRHLKARSSLKSGTKNP